MAREYVEREIIEYRGIRFVRYPLSPSHHARAYYMPLNGRGAKRDGIEDLHREVYKDHYGPIPDGYEVHHRDGNTLNNRPDNLEALSKKDHKRRHAGMTREGNARTCATCGVPFVDKGTNPGMYCSSVCKSRTKEEKRSKVEVTCEVCGVNFMGREGRRICSRRCTAVLRERNTPPKLLTCVQCGTEWESRSHKPDTRFCKKQCRDKYMWAMRKSS